MRHNPAFLALVEEVRRKVRECSVETIKEKLVSLNSIMVIDVREDHEVQKGMIPGAWHLGRGILERDIESKVLDKDTEIILYCGGGYRSALAADNLQKMGYTNVWSLDGGIKAWVADGNPLSSVEPDEASSL